MKRLTNSIILYVVAALLAFVAVGIEYARKGELRLTLIAGGLAILALGVARARRPDSSAR